MKVFDARGPFQLTRHDDSKEFNCARCTQKKVSKLRATKNGEGEYCNGCYGAMVAEAGLNV